MFAVLACGLAVSGFGQVLPIRKSGAPTSTVELQTTVQPDRFLPGEPIEVVFRFRNMSGKPLVFQAEDDWLEVVVMSLAKATGEGVPVARLKPLKVGENFTVAHTKAVELKLDITPAFHLMQPGRFKLNAALVHADLKTPAMAVPLLFEVVPGSKIWEEQFGFRPLDAAPDAPVEVRKYALQKKTDTKSVQLYVGVTDPSEEVVFRQVSLGRASNSDQPQHQVDRLSFLHVIHQTGPRLFTHTVINPRGDVLRRATYESVGGSFRPTLKEDSEGRVTVVGGQRRPQADDIPAPVAQPVAPPPPAFP